ncbi:sporulation protein [Roseovarius atlanticus]|uniref:Sporulation protein n=1 Tax=Roseovarius atlanticus TaxID=1641875 RepID=A0A0T5P068_9RHOB|nr:SPOR domain-containing protein [Roseovarius atlanticus]KRS14383.1 sporulation protein [Roseovarius atlanticus]
MAQMHGVSHQAGTVRQVSVQKFTNMAGAAISLALVIGIGVWGYKILVRDVSGVPVVRAAEGPMRIQPDNPGGATAENQGLAVNDVAADGSAAQPADRLVLAPEPLTLSVEDTPQVETQVAATQTEVDPATEEITPSAESQDAVESDEDAATLAALNTLADELSEGVDPLTPVAPADTDSAAGETAAEPEPEPAARQVTEGLGRSLRPKARPAQLKTVEDAVAASVAAQAAPEVDPDTIPAGTRMAQLGAFESAAIAEQEWGKLSDKFAEYLDDKQRVIQKAQSGGRTFYRLRAMGFGDLSDARRFCSALVAEKADCIPVVTR